MPQLWERMPGKGWRERVPGVGVPPWPSARAMRPGWDGLQLVCDSGVQLVRDSGVQPPSGAPG